MSSLNYKIYCPSYRRADVCKSHELFSRSDFTYVIRSEEVELYRPLGVKMKLIPTGAVSNIADTRNWILDHKDPGYCVMVDDDMASVNRIVERSLVKQDAEQIHEMIQLGFMLSEDAQCGLWGLNVISDPMAYSINKPFQFGRVILGPFMGILDDELRFDERLPLKEDYDFFLQQLYKHRRVLRLDMYSYLVDHHKLKGGCQTYRTLQKERDQNDLLRRKWGKVVCPNTRFKDSVNMILRTGL